jgi:hypothetical protein
MDMRSKPAILSGALVVALGALAVFAARPSVATVKSCGAVLGSQVCTWAVMDGKTSVEIGATIPMALIEGVPLDEEPEFPPKETGAVMLPAEARAATGIQYLGINWEAHGHPPAAFMTPHFDFHFYTISRDRVAAIDCSDTTKPATLPAGYIMEDLTTPDGHVLVGTCVPHMGMHSLPKKDAEGTRPFEAAMVLGYYGGAPIFVEPMIARDRLLKRTDFELPVPAVEDLPSGVRYPTTLRAEYDASADAYRLVFSGFTSG